MTTAQKYEYKTSGWPTPHGTRRRASRPTSTQLDRFQVSLSDRGIATSEQEKTMAAGAQIQMWQSEMFTEDQMAAWENKTSACTDLGRPSKHIFHRKVAGAQNSTPPPQPDNHVSKRRHYTHRRRAGRRRGEVDTGDAFRNAAGPACEADRHSWKRRTRAPWTRYCWSG
jgi:hypothetical protein